MALCRWVVQRPAAVSGAMPSGGTEAGGCEWCDAVVRCKAELTANVMFINTNYRLSNVQQHLKHHHTLPEAADLAQNRPLWKMMSTNGATQS